MHLAGALQSGLMLKMQSVCSINTELEYAESLNDIKEYLFPIAVSRTDKD